MFGDDDELDWAVALVTGPVLCARGQFQDWFEASDLQMQMQMQMQVQKQIQKQKQR